MHGQVIRNGHIHNTLYMERVIRDFSCMDNVLTNTSVCIMCHVYDSIFFLKKLVFTRTNRVETPALFAKAPG
jgi:hypothetical protein